VKAIEYERQLHNWDLELVLVEDGSGDNSFEVIKTLASAYPFIKGIKLSRNFGHQAAVRTGLEFVTGDYVAIIDDDLQDPPSLLPRFFSFLDQGFDVVYGVRKKRKESLWKRFSYNAFYKILALLSDTKIPLDSGDFCVMKKRVVDKMLMLNESQPFLRGIRAWVGFKQMGLEYEREMRIAGDSGYSLKKLLKIASDGIFSFSSIPLKVVTFLGLLSLILSILYTLFMFIKYLTVGVDSPGFITTILFISFFGSINMIGLGILGEYMARVYEETKKRPHAVIEEVIHIHSS
jgi:dolichol-phosphate mannosyltransferase